MNTPSAISLICLLCLANVPVAAEEVKPKARLISVGRVVGRLQSDATDVLTLQLPTQRVEINPAGLEKARKLQKELPARKRDIARSRNGVERQELIRQLSQEIEETMRGIYDMKDTVDLEAIGDLKVRTLTFDPGFDEMGNIRKVTRKELAEKKGKEGLPGYAAERTDLRSGQTVLVYVAREPGPRDPSAKLFVTTIVILAQPE